MIKRDRSKYGNHKFTDSKGFKWDSEKEYYRWVMLEQAQKQGKITDLQRQVKFELLPPITEEVVIQLRTKTKTKSKTLQQPVIYIADFVYTKDGQTIVEDVKGSPRLLTKEYLLKKKMMRALKGVVIKEVYSATDAI